MIRFVFILSPFQGGFKFLNEDYAKRALKDSLDRGEIPFASHLLYPQVLDDDLPKEREVGLKCEEEWIDAVLSYAKQDLGQIEVIFAVYYDHGVSEGMRRTISYAFHHENAAIALIKWRSLDEPKEPAV